MFDIVSHRSRSLRVALKAAALAVPLVWLGATNASAKDQKTITAVMHADVKIFDPIVNTADITSRFALMVFDTLFSLDQNLAPQPQKVAKVDRVEWVVLPDPQSAIQALNRGQIDFIEQPQVDLLPLLKANKDVRIEFMSPLGTQGILRLNHLQPPFTDVRARRAMQWLVNQRDFMTAAIGDPALWKVCGSFLICDQPMAFQDGAGMLNEDIPNAQRVAKAKELLQQAGYKGELVVLLDPVTNPRFHAANLVFAEALKKAGVNVQLDTMDWGTLVTRRTKKDPAGQGGWSIFFTSNGGLEASNPAFNISTSAGCDKAWWGWPCDPKLEELRSQWALATTLEARKKVAQQIQVLATEDVIYIPWGVWKSPSAMRVSLKNLLKVPDSIVFWNVEKD